MEKTSEINEVFTDRVGPLPQIRDTLGTIYSCTGYSTAERAAPPGHIPGPSMKNWVTPLKMESENGRMGSVKNDASRHVFGPASFFLEILAQETVFAGIPYRRRSTQS